MSLSSKVHYSVEVMDCANHILTLDSQKCFHLTQKEYTRGLYSPRRNNKPSYKSNNFPKNRINATMEWSELPYFRIPKTQHNKTDTEFSGINIGSRI